MRTELAEKELGEKATILTDAIGVVYPNFLGGYLINLQVLKRNRAPQRTEQPSPRKRIA